MISFKPIIRGRPATVAVVVRESASQAAVDITGWTLQIGLGRTRRELGGIFSLDMPVADGAAGEAAITVPAEITTGIKQGSVIVEVRLKGSESNEFRQVLLGRARVVTQAEYERTYIQESQATGIDQQYDGLVGQASVNLIVASDPVTDLVVNLEWQGTGGGGDVVVVDNTIVEDLDMRTYRILNSTDMYLLIDGQPTSLLSILQSLQQQINSIEIPPEPVERLEYLVDPAAPDQQDASFERSLEWIINDAGGLPTTITFRPVTGDSSVLAADGRTLFKFYQPVIVPDNIAVVIEANCVLRFDRAANGPGMNNYRHGQLILGTGGVTVPSLPVFEDLTPFSNGVWWPASARSKAELIWWNPDITGAQNASPLVSSAMALLSSGGQFELPDGKTRMNDKVYIPQGVIVGEFGELYIPTVVVGTQDGEYALEGKRANGAGLNRISFELAPDSTPSEQSSFKFSSATVSINNVTQNDIPGGLRLSNCVVTGGDITLNDTGTPASYAVQKGMKIYGGCTSVQLNNVNINGYFLNNPIECEHGLDPIEWSPGLYVSQGDYVKPTASGTAPTTFLFYVESAGTMGSTEPDWTDTDENDLVMSGDVAMIFDAEYRKNELVVLNSVNATSLLGAMRFRDCGDVQLNRLVAPNVSDDSAGQPADDYVLLDIRRTDSFTIDRLESINSLPAGDQETDLAKIYETRSVVMTNSQAINFKRGLRLLDDLTENCVVDNTNQMLMKNQRHIADSSGTPIGVRSGVRTESGYTDGATIIDEAIDMTGLV